MRARIAVLAAVVGLTASPAAALGVTYWNLFNIENEDEAAANYVTYAALDDMLNDRNRTGVFAPDDFAGGSFAANIVGSGSDGTAFWSLFNIEGEDDAAANYVTYATLADMLNDANRTGVFAPDDFAGGSFAANIVGSGSDGTTYWSLFNIEGEDEAAANYVTYASLDDMLNDRNRLGVFAPDEFAGGSFAANIVGSGAFVAAANGGGGAEVPLPPAGLLLLAAGGALAGLRRPA